MIASEEPCDFQMTGIVSVRSFVHSIVVSQQQYKIRHLVFFSLFPNFYHPRVGKGPSLGNHHRDGDAVNGRILIVHLQSRSAAKQLVHDGVSVGQLMIVK